MSDYRGDSPAKQFARMYFWQILFDFIEGHALNIKTTREPYAPQAVGGRAWGLKYLVLASEAAGDVSVLHAFGVPLEQIVACDLEEKAVNETMRRFPGVVGFCGDVAAAAAKHHPDVAFLDFCAPWYAETAETVRRTILSMKARSWLGVAVLKGRESDAQRGATLKLNRRQRRANKSSKAGVIRFWGDASECSEMATKAREIGMTEPTSRQLLKMGDFAGHTLYTDDKSKAHVDSIMSSIRRVRLMSEYMWQSTAGRKYENLFWSQYKSDTDDGPGSPMVLSAWSLTRSADASVSVLDRQYGPEFKAVGKTKADVRDAFVEHGCTEHVRLLFNISPRTAAAWKAHATMGTYDRVG